MKNEALNSVKTSRHRATLRTHCATMGLVIVQHYTLSSCMVP